MRGVVPRRARLGRRGRRESRRLDALLLCDPRRSRTFRRTDRRSATLQHRRARGVEAHVCCSRPCREAHTRQRSGRLPRGARVHRPAGGSRAMNPRIERLRELLEEPLLVTNPTNIHYLFGFKSSNAALLVDQDRARLFTDFRYSEAARAVEGVEFEETKRALLADLAGRLSGPIGFEADFVSYAGYEKLRDGSLEPVPRRGLVERLRAIKDEEELAAIKRACEITDRVFERLVEQRFVGRTERDLAWTIEQLFQDRKSTRLNSSHSQISYAVFCLNKIQTGHR